MPPEAMPRGSLASMHNFRAAQTLEAVLACIVPVAIFAVGSASYDVLHVLLLVGLVGTFLTTTLRLKPTIFSLRGGSGGSLRLLRVYSALVLLAMGTLYLANLHLLGNDFKPHKYQGVLQILGLWHPTLEDIFSFALLLALATGQSVVSERLATPPPPSSRLENNDHVVPRINGVPSWRPRWQLLLARKISTYGAVVLTFVLYCLVVFNCDVGFLGVAYLSLAVWCLAVQPQKGEWSVSLGNNNSVVLDEIILLGSRSWRDSRRTTGDQQTLLLNSSTFSWIPLLGTTILATLDFALQLSLPAIAANVYISDDVLDFLSTAVGIDVAPSTQKELALRLLRPFLILACIYTFRKLYSLGILHRQLAHAAFTEEEYQQHRLEKQWRLGAWLKRFLILHASKVVVFIAFAAAMHDPSALGWFLVAGVVLLTPLVHSNSGSTTSSTALVSIYVVSALWLLAQYIIQISWIQSLLELSTSTENVLKWIGIDYSTTTLDSPSMLESLLRWKVLLLAVVALNQKTRVWLKKLPEVVRNEAKCGAKCPLFWPPTPSYPYPELSTRSRFIGATAAAAAPAEVEDEQQQHYEQQPLLQTDSGSIQPLNTARVALHNVAQKARTLAQQALTAVDWPASPRPSAAETTTEELKEPNTTTTTTSVQLTAFRFALQDWVERCYDDWGLEIALFTLLVAAFIAANALSLVYLAAVAIGMVVPSKPRRKLWMWVVLPVLGVILIWQYSELVGLPSSLKPKQAPSSGARFLFLKWDPASSLAEDVKVWLGLLDVDSYAVWALFIAYGATVLQFYCDRQRTQHSISTCTSTNQDESTLAVPLLLNNQNHNNNTLSTQLPVEAESSFFVSPYEAQLWAPLEYSAQNQWKLHDWVRYTVYRRSLDILLVAVVALCTLDNDIIHAGYLALALFFFRSRVKLRARRNSLFAWLPLYNFGVMAIVLAYQAPFEDVWDWPLDDGTSCTLAHLLGLYKLHPSSSSPSPPPSSLSLFGGSRINISTRGGGSLLSWGYEGSIADLILWVFIRLQSHLFASPTYRQVVAVAEAEESQERAARKAEVAEWKQSQAAAAIEESGQRAARALRISRIKQGVDRNLNLLFGRTGGSVGGGVGTKEEETGSHLDFDFLDIGTGTGSTSATPTPTNSTKRRLKSTATATAPRPSVAMLTEYERTMARISEIEAEAQVIEGTNNNGEIPSTYLETEKEPHHEHHHHFEEAAPSWVGAAWQWCNAYLPRRADRRESALAYTLFVFAYLSDLSLLTLVLPLSAFVYSLVAVRPAKAYWHAVLVYCEAIIVSSYAFQVPSRLDCGFLSPQLHRTAEMMGIHANAARCIPLFFVYLATLRHTHGLITRHAAGERQRAAAAAEGREIALSGSQLDLERGTYGADDGEVVEIVEDFEGEQEEAVVTDSAAPRRSPSLSAAAQISWVSQSIEYISKSAAALCEFILTACAAQCERSPSFLLVELQKNNTDGDAGSSRSTGADIETALQDILDSKRARDVAMERFKRRESSTNLSSETWEGLVGTSTAPSSSSSSLAAMGPIKLRFHSFLDESVLPPKLPDENEADVATPAAASTTTINALLEVIPLQCTPQNTPGVCSVPGWPLRSLRPAATAAAVLVSSSTSASPETTTSSSSSLKVVAAEPHGRQARDFYALTAVLDILAFIFVAVYYNKVVQAQGSLSEITSQHEIPLGYLLTLITLFMFIVMDRVVYTLGNAAGKVALHLAEMALFFYYCSSLVWNPPDYDSGSSASAAAAAGGVDYAFSIPRDFHLRTLLALKSASFALSALQLRTGYPPPASYANGMGRHTFVFMRSLSWPASLAFHAFTAVPFLYEMRQLLDWACTATTLTLYDWLKLEDINMSLYFAAVMRASRARKPHGMRQPRYLKFFSGTLLFSLLLVLLWVPLLVFSTGNPTYQVPSLASFSVNVTLQASSVDQGLKISSPLYRGGDRGTWLQWVQPSSSSDDPSGAILPPALAVDYAPEQLQLLCTPPDADSLWSVSPPARDALTFLLESQDADVAISFGWHVQRDLPPVSEHGGPSCAGTAAIALAKESQSDLLAVLQYEKSSAPLLRKKSLISDGDTNSTTTTALFPAFWLMRGDACVARPLQEEDLRGGAGDALPSRKRRLPTNLEWADRWLACNASLETSTTSTMSNDVLPTVGQVWWRLVCGIVDSQGNIIPQEEKENNAAAAAAATTSWPLTCPSSQSTTSVFTGPRIVVLLDRVQGGIIGATISKFGVVGLYSVFVYGIGRFLRLSVTNLRMRIPFEDLPTTHRLVALCQDIYIARAEGLLGLEEELYGALITVYRLPNLLFALTKKNK